MVTQTLFKHEWDSLVRLAGKGEKWAAEQIEHLWDGHREKHVPCFMCNRRVGWPIFTQILPDSDHPSKLIAAPLCATCRELPTMTRWHRCLKILRDLNATGTKRINFPYASRRRRRI
jgi:hypothetical protein